MSPPAPRMAELSTYEAGGIDASLPKSDNTGNQTITFAIDGVTGKAQNLIQQAVDAEKRVRLTMRLYLQHGPLQTEARLPHDRQERRAGGRS
ncbi:DUF1833 family protein [Pseudomonas aeruginosa]